MRFSMTSPANRIGKETVNGIDCLRFAILVFVATMAWGGQAQTNPEIALTNIAQIRSLSREEAAKAYPVQIQGVVTWQAPDDAIIVDDGNQAIYVSLYGTNNSDNGTVGNQPRNNCEPGAIVQIQGVTDPGGYAPIIDCVKLKHVGSGTQSPRHLAMEQLLSGSADAYWVELSGVVQDVFEENGQVTGIRLFVAGQDCRVSFTRGSGLKVENLLDADVRVRGVVTPVFNNRSQAVGLKLSANGIQDIDILLPPPNNPFLAPKVPLNGLRLFSPDASTAFHRKVTQGIVSFVMPREFFFLQDGTTGVRVESANTAVQVGERVEVAGFVDMLRKIAILHEASVRSLGSATLLPMPATADTIMHPTSVNNINSHGDLNCRLVKIRGKLLQVERGGTEGCDVLILETGGQIVKGYLPQANVTNPILVASWQENSDVELTAVCELDFKNDRSVYSTVGIADFKLWLRSPADVDIIKAPPWWTVKRLWTALGVTMLLIFAGGLWSLTLQRLLRQRTHRLEEVMTAHRDVELEFISARRERLRLAADLHDGLKQLIAAASFRLEAAQGHLPDSPEDASAHLASAHNTIIRTQTELQECMRGLHALEEGPPELADLLRQVVASNDYWPPGAITIESKGTLRELPRDVAGSLLLLFQEAITNALRHGHATHIDVLVNYTANNLELKIVDNGTGFDPATVAGVRSGHFGIDGMKMRIKWLRGDFAITRHKGGGMEVSVRINWSMIPNAELKDQDFSNEA